MYRQWLPRQAIWSTVGVFIVVFLLPFGTDRGLWDREDLHGWFLIVGKVLAPLFIAQLGHLCWYSRITLIGNRLTVPLTNIHGVPHWWDLRKRTVQVGDITKMIDWSYNPKLGETLITDFIGAGGEVGGNLAGRWHEQAKISLIVKHQPPVLLSVKHYGKPILSYLMDTLTEQNTQIDFGTYRV